MVVGPLSWGNYSKPYGILKGWARTNESQWTALDPMKGNLNPATYTLVKTEQLLGASSSGGGGGLSAGAAAGKEPGAGWPAARATPAPRPCMARLA